MAERDLEVDAVEQMAEPLVMPTRIIQSEVGIADATRLPAALSPEPNRRNAGSAHS